MSCEQVLIDESFKRCYCGNCCGQFVLESQKSSSIEPCQILTKNKKLCKPKKKVLNNEVDWYLHLAKLERLAKPHEPCCPTCPPCRGAKVPLKKLCSRIKVLATPRDPRKKRQYVKDQNEVKPPVSIKNWPKHCRWLQENAQPKMYFNPECDRPQAERCGPKLYKLKRTLWLSEPTYRRSKVICPCGHTIAEPITKVTEAAKNYCPSPHILRLAEPKPFIFGRIYQEHVPECCLTFVSPKALRYKGEFIKGFFSIN